MNTLHERSIRGQIEVCELFGQKAKAKRLTEVLIKERRVRSNEVKVFEGVLVPAGWDRQENINRLSLFTQDDEDIILKHRFGMRQFKPYLNQKVKIYGKISSNNNNERTIYVNKITENFWIVGT
jgi:hypothetical protein